MNLLSELIISKKYLENWRVRNEEAFKELYGAEKGRFAAKAEKIFRIRASDYKNESTNAPFSALIDSSNPDSGPYGGMSFVIFPIQQGPSLVAFGTGTAGLSPDEHIIGRPGHSRKLNAICNWLNNEYGNGKIVAWAKHDPVRTDLEIPKTIENIFSQYSEIFSRYGKELYGFFIPQENNITFNEMALKAFLDLLFQEKGELPLSVHRKDYESIRTKYFNHILPSFNQNKVINLLLDRRFVILQGPPGTGKTTHSQKLLNEIYLNNGCIVQFHPNITYENFIGGLSPEESSVDVGLSFKPKKGILINAIEAAMVSPDKDYLLVIDEINRADLAKILGEAIFLLEVNPLYEREVILNYDFGGDIGKKLKLPKNLHVLGTMNTVDRSIAILDVAVRRRFSFITIWPEFKIVEEGGCEIMIKAFIDLTTIFVEYAPEESFSLLPGQSYFLELDYNKAVDSLRTNLLPLLSEYIEQGYVAGFSDSIRSYIQWILSLKYE